MARTEMTDWHDAIDLISRFLKEADRQRVSGAPYTAQYVGSRRRRVREFIERRPGLNPQLVEMLDELVKYAARALAAQQSSKS